MITADRDAAGTPLYDMHCHLGFCPDPAATVRELAARGAAGGLCCAVTPAQTRRVASLLAGASGWQVGVGLHPWWAGEADVEDACRLLAEGPCLAGELGLDFGGAHVGTREAQVAAFSCALDAVQAGSVLSLHAVRSADVVLDLLEERGLTRSCTCILHWFSGSGPELTRAVRAGCRFSVGVLMLRSRRGREYARQLPADRLLLETDFPDRNHPEPAATCAEDMAAALRDACAKIAQLRGVDADALAETLAGNSKQVLARA